METTVLRPEDVEAVKELIAWLNSDAASGFWTRAFEALESQVLQGSL